MTGAKDETKPLQGYRLVFPSQDHYPYDIFYKSKGASILSLSDAPDTEQEFKSWWHRTVSKACKDKVILVVVKTSYGAANRRLWLQAIEEEEWMDNDNCPNTVRFATFSNLDRAVFADTELVDDWNDEIESGLDVWPAEESSVSSKSSEENEFDG